MITIEKAKDSASCLSCGRANWEVEEIERMLNDDEIMYEFTIQHSSFANKLSICSTCLKKAEDEIKIHLEEDMGKLGTYSVLVDQLQESDVEFDELPEILQIVCVINDLDTEVCNGGFSQWYDNGCMEHKDLLLQTLYDIDTDHSKSVAKLVEQVIDSIEEYNDTIKAFKFGAEHHGVYMDDLDYWVIGMSAHLERTHVMSMDMPVELIFKNSHSPSTVDDYYYKLCDKFMKDVNKFLKSAQKNN